MALYPPLNEPPLERAVLVPGLPGERPGEDLVPVPTRPRFAASWQRFFLNLLTEIGEMRDGPIVLPNLPTVDPHVRDQVWNDAGTLKISAG